MDIIKPRLNSATFLIYVGAATLLVALVDVLFTVIDAPFGGGEYTGWALAGTIVLLAAAVLAEWFLRQLTAGALALGAVVLLGLTVASALAWAGQDVESSIDGFGWENMVVALALAVGSILLLGRWKFPLAVALAVSSIFYIIIDALSNGGNWSFILSVLIGLVLLLVGAGLDGGGGHPYAFWVHLAAGLMIGIGLLNFWSDNSDLDWTLMALVGLAYIGLGKALMRSSWAVLGAIWLAGTATHFADRLDGSNDGGSGRLLYGVPGVSLVNQIPQGGTREWVPPLIYGIYALVLLGLAYLLAQRWSPAEGGPTAASALVPTPPSEPPKVAAATPAEPEA